MKVANLRPLTTEMISIYVLGHLSCRLHNSDAAVHYSA